MEFTTDIFKVFNEKWALITAGNKNAFNTMTISWGGMGTMWGKPVVTAYVRKSRYTHEFIDDNEFFTVSFYPEEYKDKLKILGSVSGRDMDKMNDSGLTVKDAGNTVTFDEAEITFVCKKLFKQTLETENMPADIVKSMYADGDLHDMYIAEVVDIIR